MIYQELAKYYDGLVKDDVATKAWVDLITQHIQKQQLMELACGSGEITLALAKQGYQIDASDLSAQMIEAAKQKQGAELVHFYCMDMLAFQAKTTYDGVICLCDSINYIVKEAQLAVLFKQIYEVLNEDGTFIFDTHSLDRLHEFKEEFYEEGVVNGQQYTWSIVADEECIYHNFLFYDEQANVSLEQHIQRVYPPEVLDRLLAPYFTFTVMTDFTQAGICEGEKYFYICKKKEQTL